jgi:hypothetical protein
VNTATDLILAGALTGIWLTAGVLVETLPTARTARELRRRTGLLSILVGAGAAVFVAVPVVTALFPGASAAPAAALLPAVPAMIVLTSTRRRLAQVRGGAGAFATAPLAPLPPGLRAAAAHPLIAVPLQVTGLVTLVGLPIAAGVLTVPDSNVAGIAITVVGVAVVATIVRAGVRHSRLSVPALVPRARAPRELTRVG